VDRNFHEVFEKFATGSQFFLKFASSRTAKLGILSFVKLTGQVLICFLFLAGLRGFYEPPTIMYSIIYV
jgi:hypothetical protein